MATQFIKNLCWPIFGGAATWTALWAYDYSPTKGWKHDLLHKLRMQPVMIQSYTNIHGANVLGARCVNCGKISEGDEHPDALEPIDDARTRMHHKLWSERTGYKGHDLYLATYKTPEFQKQVEEELSKKQYGPPRY